MKISTLFAGLLGFAAFNGAIASNWSPEDHEIFDIVSALEQAEGKNTTFYSFLNITRSAKDKEISKAYKKRSLELHPDKNPNDPNIEKRFARLGVIANILRDGEKRSRYDHFYDNGFPKWRGTGYYYSRYRPGVGAVFIALTLFTCWLHYFILILQRYLAIQRVQRFQDDALEFAWGPARKITGGRKRFKIKAGEDGKASIHGVNGGHPIGPGQIIEAVVEGEQVFVVEEKKEFLVTADNIPWPSIKDIWVFTRFKSKFEPSAQVDSNSEQQPEDFAEKYATPTPEEKPTEKTKALRKRNKK